METRSQKRAAFSGEEDERKKSRLSVLDDDNSEEDSETSTSESDSDAAPPPRLRRAQTAPPKKKTPQKKLRKRKTIATTQPSVAVELPEFSVVPTIPGQLKMMAWNINGFKKSIEKGILAKYLQREDPDIFFVQELKISTQYAKDVTNPFPGYHMYLNPCSEAGKPINGGYSGTGLFSKEKPIRVQFGMGQAKFDGEGRLILAEYPDFLVIGAYVPNSGTGLKRLAFRLEWDQAFIRFVKATVAASGNKPFVWMGDLNVAHQPIDLANPKTNTKTAGFSPQERASFTEILAEIGAVDAFRHLNPEAKAVYTFWSTRFGGASNRARNVGWRLDYFVVSRTLVDQGRLQAVHTRTQSRPVQPASIPPPGADGLLPLRYTVAARALAAIVTATSPVRALASSSLADQITCHMLQHCAGSGAPFQGRFFLTKAMRTPRRSGMGFKTAASIPPPYGDLSLTVAKWGSLPASRNTVFVHPSAKERLRSNHVLIRDTYVFPLDSTDQVRPEQIACGMVQRKWAVLPENQQYVVKPFIPTQMLESVVFVVDFFAGPRKVVLEGKKIVEQVKQLWDRHCIVEGQPHYLEVDSVGFVLTATDVKVVDIAGVVSGKEAEALRSATSTTIPPHGIFTPNTSVSLHKNPEAQLLTLKNAGAGSRETIIKEGFKFENMGIGGLDNEFATILRRAFASRYYPAELVARMGIKHVRGILLYGPPGTGKTLLARQIGKMLNSHEPKVVSGPEILNKFVGESERNMRELFADAEAEYKEKGDDSDLHLVIFDEIDAICKSRGSYSGGTGVGDSVVNQLLAKMDGVESLNNILVIGMTNRKDLIDDALLRPGRLEVRKLVMMRDDVMFVGFEAGPLSGNVHK
ncbi:putative Vesicle-fusing ATPase [Paratrimastix pyriformis]|uniref:Vesicle-fusing ATPase n=1 Tax=Paratrimastix pyriformis TaxID=342808 RepID=A0ABQ8UCR1_9EUKA|nr:putative Vesicle-fusing ATPase [Paratrimastix pyriformis]